MGWYSIYIAKSYPSCNVHAFEPIPKTYLFLEQNIKLNHLHNVFPHQFGLSDKCKDTTFYYYPEGSGNASSANLSERDDVELVTCHLERMDDFISSRGLSVDFIKVDVEGAELFTFQGGLETLKRDKPIVFTEMLRKWSAKFDYHPNDIINLLTSFGYRCFFTCKGKLEEIAVMDSSTDATNFFFLHKDKHLEKISNYAR